MSSKTGAKPSLLVIGGRGRMGANFARFFDACGYAVEIAEKGDELAHDFIVRFDFVLLAVPMDAAEAVARAVGKHVRKDALLFDINSLKHDICMSMEQQCRGEVLGLHPMFGPSVENIEHQKILYCPVRHGPRAMQILDDLRGLGAELLECSPEQHDKMMAYVQVLLHFTKIGFATVLEESGISLKELLKYMSPLSLLEITMVGRLFAQSSDLCADIQLKNSHGEVVRKELQKTFAALAKVLADGDQAEFKKRFESVRKYLGAFTLQAQSLSDSMIRDLAKDMKRMEP